MLHKRIPIIHLINLSLLTILLTNLSACSETYGSSRLQWQSDDSPADSLSAQLEAFGRYVANDSYQQMAEKISFYDEGTLFWVNPGLVPDQDTPELARRFLFLNWLESENAKFAIEYIVGNSSTDSGFWYQGSEYYGPIDHDLLCYMFDQYADGSLWGPQGQCQEWFQDYTGEISESGKAFSDHLNRYYPTKILVHFDSIRSMSYALPQSFISLYQSSQGEQQGAFFKSFSDSKPFGRDGNIIPEGQESPFALINYQSWMPFYYHGTYVEGVAKRTFYVNVNQMDPQFGRFGVLEFAEEHTYSQILDVDFYRDSTGMKEFLATYLKLADE